MFQSTLFFAVCLVIATLPQDGVKSLLPTSTQQTQDSSQTNAPTSDEDERVKAEVAEIMAIRKQLGGGVAETLGDLSLKMPGSKSPETDSTKSIAKSFKLEETFAKELAEQSRTHIARENANGDWELVASKKPQKTNQPASPEHRDRIRQAARMLEEAAALLEEAQQYGQADNVRENARQLWQSAR